MPRPPSRRENAHVLVLFLCVAACLVVALWPRPPVAGTNGAGADRAPAETLAPRAR